MSAGLDKLDDYLPSIDVVPEEVELDVDVLAPIVEDRVLGEGDGGLVVHHQSWRVSFLAGQLAQQPAQPDSLAHRRGYCDVLRLASQQRHDLLLQRLSSNGGRSKEDEHVGGAPSPVDVAHHVCVAENSELRLTFLCLGGASLKTVSHNPPLPPLLGKMIA